MSKLILLAEDSEEDGLLFEMALRRGGLANPLVVVRDGDEVIAYLKGEGPYADRLRYPLPAVLFLDLKMPRLGGFGVLEWIRKEPRFRSLIIVVLSQFSELSEMGRAYQMGARTFLAKPVTARDIENFTAAFGGTWVQSGSIDEPQPIDQAKGGAAVRPSAATSPSGMLAVLIAEDSADDLFFLKQAFHGVRHLKIVGTVHDGDEAIAYLSGEGEYADRGRFPLPDILLTDLKMPRKSGLEVIEWLHAHHFQGLKVVMLTGSARAADYQRARELGVDAFHFKPSNPADLGPLVRSLEDHLIMAARTRSWEREKILSFP